jgi:hypothetical protein
LEKPFPELKIDEVKRGIARMKMEMKKAYRIDKLATLFNTSKRQIYRLLNNGTLQRDIDNGIFVTGISVKKYLNMYVKDCPLPVYTSEQISQRFEISLRTIYSFIKDGDIEYIKINPDSKNNKAIRIPLDTKKNTFIFDNLRRDIKMPPGPHQWLLNF